jgi:hypothetical protein
MGNAYPQIDGGGEGRKIMARENFGGLQSKLFFPGQNSKTELLVSELNAVGNPDGQSFFGPDRPVAEINLMVTPRKLNPAQPGRKSAIKMPMFEIDITQPPPHFDDLHCQMWDFTVNYPTFVGTAASYAELKEALEHHIVYCDLTGQIEAMHQNGEKPERRLELARAAARRPYARFLKKLVLEVPKR